MLKIIYVVVENLLKSTINFMFFFNKEIFINLQR